jgi:hypothetical protein
LLFPVRLAELLMLCNSSILGVKATPAKRVLLLLAGRAIGYQRIEWKNPGRE